MPTRSCLGIALQRRHKVVRTFAATAFANEVMCKVPMKAADAAALVSSELLVGVTAGAGSRSPNRSQCVWLVEEGRSLRSVGRE